MNRLDQNTIKLISSGQVVTSISNVVKELVENALDAEATNIEIKLINYGLDLIEIKDNGHGVSSQDIPLMIADHCTSKIKDFNDLSLIETYGFRGEALNSICSISSSIEILSKRNQDQVAKMIKFDAKGSKIKESNMASLTGTCIKIFDLFQGLPVRRNYYRKSKNRLKDDLKKIENIVWSFALIHPKLRISVTHDGQQMMLKTACDSLMKNCQQAFGIEIASNLEQHNFEYSEEIIINAILPKMDCKENLVKSNNDKTFLFINSRPMRCKESEKILKSIFQDKFPIGILSFKIPKDKVEINLESDKSLILFENQKIILDFLLENLAKIYQIENNQENPEPSKDGDSASWSKGTLFKSGPPVALLVNKINNDIIENPQFNKKKININKTGNNSVFSEAKNRRISGGDNDSAFFDAKQRQTLITSFGEDLTQNDIITPPKAKKQKVEKSPKTPKIQKKVFEEEENIEEESFSKQIISVKFQMSKVIQNEENEEDEFQDETIIGQLQPSGFWIVNVSQELVIFNHLRVQEILIFKRLVQNHRLLSSPLPKGPMNLLKESRWNPDLTPILESLKTDDKRLTLNGIKIKKTAESGFLLTEVSPKIPFMGITDILEILQVIQKNPNAQVEECRPLKVTAFLKSEVKRIMAQSPPNVDQFEVQELLSFVAEENLDVCIHSKPLFHSLISRRVDE